MERVWQRERRWRRTVQQQLRIGANAVRDKPDILIRTNGPAYIRSVVRKGDADAALG